MFVVHIVHGGEPAVLYDTQYRFRTEVVIVLGKAGVVLTYGMDVGPFGMDVVRVVVSGL